MSRAAPGELRAPHPWGRGGGGERRADWGALGSAAWGCRGSLGFQLQEWTGFPGALLGWPASAFRPGDWEPRQTTGQAPSIPGNVWVWGCSGLQNQVGEHTVRLEVALEGCVRGGDRPPRRVGPTEKCRGPGSSPLTRPPAEETGGGGAARAAHARRGLERPDRPAAGSAQEPPAAPKRRVPAPGAVSGAAQRSPQPAGAAVRRSPGSGHQDVRASEYCPPAGTPGWLHPAGPVTSCSLPQA